MAIFDFLSLRKQVESAGAEIRTHRRVLEGLRRERDLVAAAPLSRGDTLRALHARIDAEGSRHLKIFTGTLRQLVLKGCPDRIDGPILACQKPDVPPTPASLEAAISLMFADQFKASVAGVVESMEWPQGSMDHADKQKKLADLDARIGKIETDLTGLVRSARAAGITV
jgi:hypothetical protein